MSNIGVISLRLGEITIWAKLGLSPGREKQITDTNQALFNANLIGQKYLWAKYFFGLN